MKAQVGKAMDAIKELRKKNKIESVREKTRDRKLN